jgi:hypothetical protein
VGETLWTVLKAWIVRRFGECHGLAELRKELVLAGVDHNLAVLGLERCRGGDDPTDVAERLGAFASDPMILRPVNEESDLAAHQPDIDRLALAGLLPLKQGS